MQARWILIPLAMLAVAALLIARGCGGSTTPSRQPAPSTSHAAAPSPTAPASSSSPADVSAAARSRAREDALRDAVSTLHRYLAALFGNDRAQADAYWVDSRPSQIGEADLRALPAVAAMRSENGDPKSLDAQAPNTDAVPNALEIPIEIRLDTSGHQLRYRGWYRLRRDIDGRHWRLSSAALQRQSR